MNRYIVIYRNAALCDGDGMICRYEGYAASSQEVADRVREMYGSICELKYIYLLIDMTGDWR